VIRNALTVLGILAIGMTVVIITGGIDLSVGSVLALSMMMMGWLTREVGVPLPLAVLTGIATGAVCGLVSGLLITKARLPAFIATLTMLSMARGLANLPTDGLQIVGYAEWFTSLATVRHFGFFSATVTLFILLSVLAGA
jgi:ribose transport system permease protein